MDDGILPPFGQAPGPPVTDGEVLSAFLRGEPAGHSDRFHVEGSVLVAGFDLSVGMRLGPDTVLTRRDIPQGMEDARRSLHEALSAEGMTLLDEETLLATPVAVQWLGLRGSSWDLWGRDIDASFAALRTAAVSDSFGPPIVE